MFLNISRDEQRNRLQERIDDPEKRWKFRRDDLEVRKRFDDYVAAYEEVLTETTRRCSPRRRPNGRRGTSSRRIATG